MAPANFRKAAVVRLVFLAKPYDPADVCTLLERPTAA
jgi:hypothetical protein